VSVYGLYDLGFDSREEEEEEEEEIFFLLQNVRLGAGAQPVS
jgi:hypothetical protein